MPGQFDTIETGHDQVDDRHVGALAAYHHEPLLAIFGLAHHLYRVGLWSDERADDQPEVEVVIHDNDCYCHGHPPHRIRVTFCTGCACTTGNQGARFGQQSSLRWEETTRPKWEQW